MAHDSLNLAENSITKSDHLMSRSLADDI